VSDERSRGVVEGAFDRNEAQTQLALDFGVIKPEFLAEIGSNVGSSSGLFEVGSDVDQRTTELAFEISFW